MERGELEVHLPLFSPPPGQCPSALPGQTEGRVSGPLPFVRAETHVQAEASAHLAAPGLCFLLLVPILSRGTLANRWL